MAGIFAAGAADTAGATAGSAAADTAASTAADTAASSAATDAAGSSVADTTAADAGAATADSGSAAGGAGGEGGMSSMMGGGGGGGGMPGMGGGGGGGMPGGMDMSKMPGMDKLSGIMNSAQKTTGMISGGPSPTSADGYLAVLKNAGHPLAQLPMGNTQPVAPTTAPTTGQQGAQGQNTISNGIGQLKNVYSSLQNMYNSGGK